VSWTPEQVLALAANDGARNNAHSLARASKWLTLGTDERAIWGEIKGSSPQPYQVRIDLSEPAFKCDCASRQQPCKYAIGLFLLFANEPGIFKSDQPPQWVTAWIASRDVRAIKKEPSTVVIDAEAQARRMAQRKAKVADGMLELDLWLRDLMRNGLASVQGQGYLFWDAPAARMVDAQARGIANQIRDMAAVPVSGEGWPERLLEKLSRLYLLAEGYRNLDKLSPEIQADMRSIIGWSQKQEDLHDEPSIRDQWLVVGRRVEEEDNQLRSQRTWLWGMNSRCYAMLLDFAFGNAAFENVLSPGICVEADLIFYPSNYLLRAFIKQRQRTVTPPNEVGGTTIAEAFANYSAALARQPWLNLFPMCIHNVIPLVDGSRWVVRDAAGHILPLSQNTADDHWKLLAVSGGHPITIFGEWNSDTFRFLSALADGRLVAW
jgi:hypothetical protein